MTNAKTIAWKDLTDGQRDQLILALADGSLPDTVVRVLIDDDHIVSTCTRVKALLTVTQARLGDLRRALEAGQPVEQERKAAIAQQNLLQALLGRLGPLVKARNTKLGPDAFAKLFLEVTNHRAASERGDYEPTDFDRKLWDAADRIKSEVTGK